MEEKELSGRELDFAVAERVLGWVRGTRWGNGNGGWTIDGKPYEEHRRSWNQTPHFSSDIAAAMEVVDKLLGVFTFELRWVAVWMARFDHLETGEHCGFAANHPAVPAAEAICRAALKAVGRTQSNTSAEGSAPPETLNNRS